MFGLSRLATISLIAIVLLGGISCAGCDQPAPETPEPQEDPAIAQGAELYGEYCALCHGAEGEGYAADNANALNNQRFLAVATDSFLRQAIAQGRPSTAMSAWSRLRGGPLSGGDIHKIVRFIRSWQDGPDADVHSLRVTGDAQRAAPIYAERCASCHGDEGQGQSALSLNNPRFLASASDGFLRYSIVHGRPGTPMPAFENSLSTQETDDLVVLIRSWAREVTSRTPVGDVQIDYSNIVVNPGGEAPEFTLREGRYVASVQVRDALAAGQRIILLDARPTSDWLEEHITGAVPVPFYDMDRLVGELPRDGTHIVAYCGCPHAASGRVVDRLRREGFENTSVLDEGVRHWIDEGYPSTQGQPSRPTQASDSVEASAASPSVDD